MYGGSQAVGNAPRVGIRGCFPPAKKVTLQLFIVCYFYIFRCLDPESRGTFSLFISNRNLPY